VLSLTQPSRVLASIGRAVARVLGGPAASPADPEAAAALAEAEAARRAGRPDEARRLYRAVLDRRRHDTGALRGLRDLAVAEADWRQALGLAERALAAATTLERAADAGTLAAIHYQLGRAEMEAGRPSAALGHFRNALKTDRDFVPAALALGDALDQTGDHREAVKTWERTAEVRPALPVLARLEKAYRDEGRPSRMIALYRTATERAPDDLGVAVALGRVYFELEMLDEAAEQFERLEVRVPNEPVIHAYLGAVFERRGEGREACEEYRRALRLADAFHWPQRCAACGARATTWRDRCPQCGRWNTSRSNEPR
jgi:lipopolysaccharide biosynthesis regulator YciM